MLAKLANTLLQGRNLYALFVFIIVFQINVVIAVEIMLTVNCRDQTLTSVSSYTICIF